MHFVRDQRLSVSLRCICRVASATAAATFRLPAPASINPAPAIRELVSCSVAFTCAGVSVRPRLEQQRRRPRHHRGRHARAAHLDISTTARARSPRAPDTCAPGSPPAPTPPRSGCPAPPAPASARRRSASARASCTSPSRRRTARAVPRVFTAPTVSTDGVLPGEITPPTIGRPSAVFPKFPAAATTRIPASAARSAAWHSGSSRYDSNTGCPSDRLMIRMLNAAGSRSPSRSPR